MDPIRVGAIGCGRLSSSHHLPAIQRIPELELVALCDIDGERLGMMSGRLGVSRTYTDFVEMLEDAPIDAVSCVGPPELHMLGALACMERQIPFMTEKPLALHIPDVVRLEAAAEKYGDCGQIGYTSRCAPAQRVARNVSRRADFGPICYVATTHLNYDPMGPCWDIEDPVEGYINLHGVHAIDLWRFFGGDPVEVAASVAGRRTDDGGGRLSVLAYVRTEDGPHGTIQMRSGASHNGDVNADVMGDGTRVRAENNRHVIYERGQEWLKEAMKDDVLADTMGGDTPAGEFMSSGMGIDSYMDFFRYEWMAFARRLQSGAELSPSVLDACKTVRLTHAICGSIRNGGATTTVQYR